MRVTIEAKGRDPGQLIRETERDMKRATREVAKPVAAAGRKAILATAKSHGAARFAGKTLGVKTKTHASATKATIEFRGAPAGAWTIATTGAKPHPIRPRRRKALAFNGRFAERVAHPGVHGRQVWTLAGPALDEAIRPVIVDVFDEAVD